MIGSTLGGRYELLERIGGGGMALVYKGRDTLLGRNVAVKVLRHQYVHDEEFIRRFRREAQSAASLSHPNVVSVYDVGQEEDTHYIVMELVEGTNLNDKIKQQAPLQPTEAVHIAVQICDALDHAHTNGIIHRDIKPHNILIGKNGRVKVTDFGIARAATSSSITQTGSVIGSVHYFSPEHAKGVAAGEKSDLYSLGIVLYEMVTAKLPFLGESPISVALKHLQEQVEEPRVINPLIPQSVENIILKALRKRPEERYATAGEMLRDLEMCLSPERRNETKWTYASDQEEDLEATRVMPALRFDGKQAGFAADEDTSNGGRNTNGAPVWREGRYEDDDSSEREPNAWLKPLIWFGVLLVLLGAAWFGVMKIKELTVIPTVDVPNVEGMTLERAEEQIEGAGLTVEQPVMFEFNRDVPANYVIRQSKANETARLETPIRLTVSKGKETVVVPELIGSTEAEALNELTALGIAEPSVEIEEQFSDEAVGTVVNQYPSGGETIDPIDTSIRLVVSKGREQASMPNLIGLTEQEALALLEREGLEIAPDHIVREPAYSPEGKVFKQFPYNPGEAVKPPGSEIMIYLSSGMPKEAIETQYRVTIGASRSGESSSVRLLVTDAMGDRVEAVNRTVASEETFSVPVVTSPAKNAVIEVFRDDEKIDQITWTYQQATQGEGAATDSGDSAMAQQSEPGSDSSLESEAESEAGGN